MSSKSEDSNASKSDLVETILKRHEIINLFGTFSNVKGNRLLMLASICVDIFQELFNNVGSQYENKFSEIKHRMDSLFERLRDNKKLCNIHELLEHIKNNGVIENFKQASLYISLNIRSMNEEEIEQYILFYAECLRVYEEYKKLNHLCILLNEFQRLDGIKHTHKYICPNLEGHKHFYDLNIISKFLPNNIKNLHLSSETLVKQMNTYDKICGVYLWVVELLLINLCIVFAMLLNIYVFHPSPYFATLTIITGTVLIVLLTIPITYVKSGWFTRIRYENEFYQLRIKKLPYTLKFKQETNIILNSITQYVYSPTITKQINDEIGALQREIITLKRELKIE